MSNFFIRSVHKYFRSYHLVLCPEALRKRSPRASPKRTWPLVFLGSRSC